MVGRSRELAFDNFGIYKVELVAPGQRRLGNACHNGCIFAYKVGHIGHIPSLLKHVIASF